ncbi:MAG TPA: hypothetical protein VFE61_24575 [Candidatus Sulfotelmatobacter sp.]|nr:hypothetical protein [Candidatus Sulfotelmatobacter sp.]
MEVYRNRASGLAGSRYDLRGLKRSRLARRREHADAIMTRNCSLILAVAWLAVPALSGQQTTNATPAPVPAQIVAAGKVFISNGGADIVSQSTFKRAGDPDQAYNHFYSAMQSWARYELVSAPAEADLVFELRFTAPMYMDGNLAVCQPQFGLSILDAKTHFLLWTLAEPVDGAFRKATWLKNFDHGLDALMDDLKKLAASGAAASVDPSKK